MQFSLFTCSLNPFKSLFSVYAFCTFVKFTNKYFIIVGTVVSRIIFLISVSDGSSLVYTTDFYMLVLSLASLLSSSVSSTVVLAASLQHF